MKESPQLIETTQRMLFQDIYPLGCFNPLEKIFYQIEYQPNMKTIPEPDAELMPFKNVQEDVSSLTAALELRRAEKRAYKILEKPSVKKALDKLISSGICENEEEAIERALNELITELAK